MNYQFFDVFGMKHMYIYTFLEIQFLRTSFLRKLSMVFDENDQNQISEKLNNNILKNCNFYTYVEGLFIKKNINLILLLF